MGLGWLACRTRGGGDERLLEKPRCRWDDNITRSSGKN
jgi:hypothetical protein